MRLYSHGSSYVAVLRHSGAFSYLNVNISILRGSHREPRKCTGLWSQFDIEVTQTHSVKEVTVKGWLFSLTIVTSQNYSIYTRVWSICSSHTIKSFSEPEGWTGKSVQKSLVHKQHAKNAFIWVMTSQQS